VQEYCPDRLRTRQDFILVVGGNHRQWHQWIVRPEISGQLQAVPARHIEIDQRNVKRPFFCMGEGFIGVSRFDAFPIRIKRFHGLGRSHPGQFAVVNYEEPVCHAASVFSCLDGAARTLMFRISVSSGKGRI
jgi:hypothetical protein